LFFFFFLSVDTVSWAPLFDAVPTSFDSSFSVDWVQRAPGMDDPLPTTPGTYISGTRSTVLQSPLDSLPAPTPVSVSFGAYIDDNGAVIWSDDIATGSPTGSDAGVNGGPIALDNLGNAFFTGTFSQSTLYVHGEMYNNTAPTTASTDIFVQKRDQTGTVIWTVTFGSDRDDSVTAVQWSDGGENGEVVLLGYFTGGSLLCGGFSLPNAGSSDTWDIFIVHISTAGSITSAQRFGGTNYDEPQSLAISQDGSVSFIGSFYDYQEPEVIISGPDFQLSSQVGSNFFWLHISSDSIIGNSYSFSDGSASLSAMTIDPTNANRLLLAGTIQGSITLDEVTASGDSGNAFLAHVDVNEGTFVDLTNFAASPIISMVVSCSHVFLTGTLGLTGASATFPPLSTINQPGGSYQSNYLVKLDATTFDGIWGQSVQSTQGCQMSSDTGGQHFALGCKVSSTDFIFNGNTATFSAPGEFLALFQDNAPAACIQPAEPITCDCPTHLGTTLNFVRSHLSSAAAAELLVS